MIWGYGLLTNNLIINFMESNNTINLKDNSFSLLSFLAAQEGKPYDPIQQRIIQTIGITSLISASSFAVVFTLYLDSYIERLPLTILLGSIFILFCLFINRTIFLFGSGKTKTISIVLYLLLYLVLSYLLSYYFLYFFIEAEIAKYCKDQTALENAEALIKSLSHLNTKQKHTVSDFRLLITFILWCVSLLPLINFLWFSKSQLNEDDFEADNRILIQSIQNKILKKKEEYIHLLSETPENNSDDPFNDNSIDPKSLANKREALLQEILNLERSLQIL